MRYPALLGALTGMIIFLAAAGAFFLTLVICAELDGYRFKLVENPQGQAVRCEPKEPTHD